MTKGKAKSNKYKLPDPVLPDLKPPKPPKTGREKEEYHVSCEQAVYQPLKENPAILPPPEGKARVMIAVPVLTFGYEFITCFINFWTQICLNKDSKFEAGFNFAHRKPVHMAEEQLVDVARYNKCTHILFIDDDIWDYNVQDLEQLLEADKDVIGGVMYTSGFPYTMCAFRRYNVDKKLIDMPSDNKIERLYEVPCLCPSCGTAMAFWDAKFCPTCGGACDNILQKVDLIPFCFTLMKMSIFNKIKEPAFYCSNKYPSDSWFADKCKEAKVQQWAHMGVRLTHRGVNHQNRVHYQRMKLEEKSAKEDPGLVGVSQEDMDKHQMIMHNKMKEAEDKLKPTLAIAGNRKGAKDA